MKLVCVENRYNTPTISGCQLLYDVTIGKMISIEIKLQMSLKKSMLN